MRIDILSAGKISVSIDNSELERMGTSFESMDTKDCATRRLLSDIFLLLSHMGIRKNKERAEIDCIKSKEGCLLLISVKEGRFERFSGVDAVIDAARAGALPKGPLNLLRSTDGSYLLELSEPPEGEALAFLKEFCE